MVYLNEVVFKTLILGKVMRNGKNVFVAIGTYNTEVYESLKSESCDLLKLILVASLRGITFDSYEYAGVLDLEVQEVPLELYNSSCFVKKVVRSLPKFAPFVEFIHQGVNINPTSVCDEIVYCNPYFVRDTGEVLCVWSPSFEETVSFKNDGSCFVYSYKQPIYLLLEESKRHITDELCEVLIIDTKTGRITCEYKNSIGDCFVKALYEVSDGKWKTVRQEKIDILSTKQVSRR